MLWGVLSIKILMHSLKTGTVVKMTRTENRYVQIGSTILKSGLTMITIDAIITPIDCKRSPIKCTIAALMLMFSWWELELSCLWPWWSCLSWWSWLWSPWSWLWSWWLPFVWFFSSFLLRRWWWCFCSDFAIVLKVFTSSNSLINLCELESFKVADLISDITLDSDSISLETGNI